MKKRRYLRTVPHFAFVMIKQSKSNSMYLTLTKIVSSRYIPYVCSCLVAHQLLLHQIIMVHSFCLCYANFGLQLSSIVNYCQQSSRVNSNFLTSTRFEFWTFSFQLFVTISHAFNITINFTKYFLSAQTINFVE